MGTTTLVNPMLVKELEPIEDPGRLMAELFRQFGNRCAIGTGGQLTGSALIDMAVKAGVAKPRVFTNDTLRLFPETYDLFRRIEARYGITIERFTPDPSKLEAMIRQHGEYLFFDSEAKQKLCCRLRKVEPNQRALDTLNVWITGLRADQSEARASTQRLEILQHPLPNGGTRPLLKAAPLVTWTEEQVRAYLAANNVPTHTLLTQQLPGGWRYESLGCIICTTSIGPDEPRRAGRWRWFNAAAAGDDKECGLHLPQNKQT